MMIRGLAVCLAVFTAGEAAALSCLPADPVRDFVFARDAKASFRVVLGSVSMPKIRVKRDHSDINGPTPKTISVEAQVVGTQLSNSGIDAEFAGTVTISASCSGPWCAELPQSTKRALLFLQDDGQQMTLDLYACPGMFYPNIADKDIKRVERCHTTGTCDVPEF